MSEQRQNYIGIAFSGSHVRAALVDSSGQILEHREAEVSAENLVEQVAKISRDLSSNSKVEAIGIAIPGLVNRQTDRVISSRFMSTVGENLHGEFTRATGLRVEIENDANAAAYGEFQIGAGAGCRDMFYMMIGESIGGAIILDGKLWTGSSRSE